jgi:hypothetical protein
VNTVVTLADLNERTELEIYEKNVIAGYGGCGVDGGDPLPDYHCSTPLPRPSPLRALISVRFSAAL